MNYKLPEEVLNSLIQYLSQKPYAEVHQGISALQKLEKLDE